MPSEEKAAKVKMIILDVDGVMTDGRVVIGDDSTESKFFDIKDGFGISLAHRVGIKTAIISGRKCDATTKRAKELGIEEVHQNIFVKMDCYKEIKQKYNLKDENFAFIGDDLIDLPMLSVVGFSGAVADATSCLIERVDFVSSKKGGRGAVREFIEFIIKANGLWEKAVERYFKPVESD